MFRIWYKSVNGYGEASPTVATYQTDTNGGTKVIVVEPVEESEEEEETTTPIVEK